MRPEKPVHLRILPTKGPRESPVDLSVPTQTTVSGDFLPKSQAIWIMERAILAGASGAVE
jgi:hypothetical protein